MLGDDVDGETVAVPTVAHRLAQRTRADWWPDISSYRVRCADSDPYVNPNRPARRPTPDIQRVIAELRRFFPDEFPDDTEG